MKGLHVALAVPLTLVALAPAAAADQGFVDVPLELPWNCLPGEQCHNPTCARIAGAWTGASQPRVDVYISKIFKEKFDTSGGISVQPDKLIETVLERAEDHATRLMEKGPPMAPGQIGGRDLIVQVDLTVPKNQDAGLDGLRLTFAVDVLACVGE